MGCLTHGEYVEISPCRMGAARGEPSQQLREQGVPSRLIEYCQWGRRTMAPEGLGTGVPYRPCRLNWSSCLCSPACHSTSFVQHKRQTVLCWFKIAFRVSAHVAIKEGCSWALNPLFCVCAKRKFKILTDWTRQIQVLYPTSTQNEYFRNLASSMTTALLFF